MRRAWGGALAAGIGVMALASSALAVDSKDNAALRYWRAWSLITEADDTTLGETAWGYEPGEEFEITPELVRFIEDKQQVIGLLREAAAMPACDFGIDYDKGPHALMTHLRPMRTSVHLLMLDARLHADTGDMDRVADNLEAALRLERHLADGSLIIGGLVATATFEATRRMIEHLLDEGALDADARRRLDDALATYDPVDPFGIRGGVETERDVFVAWLRKNMVTADGAGRAELDAMTDEELERLSPDERAIVEMFRSTGDWNKELEKYELFFEHALRMWDDGNAGEKLATIEKAAGSGAYGHYAKLMAPAVTRIQVQWRESVEKLAALRARLAN